MSRTKQRKYVSIVLFSAYQAASRNEFQKAEKLYWHALKLAERFFGHSSISVRDTLDSMISFYADNGDSQTALMLTAWSCARKQDRLMSSNN